MTANDPTMLVQSQNVRMCAAVVHIIILKLADGLLRDESKIGTGSRAAIAGSCVSYNYP